MFLAIREIRHEKLRYGLIIVMIFLISYLIFMLSSLAVGLARENTEAAQQWGMRRIVLNQNANLGLSQSLISRQDLKKADLTSSEARIDQAGVVVKRHARPTVSAQFLGLRRVEFIYRQQKLISGRKARGKYELTADSGLLDQGYHLGDKVKLNGIKRRFKIVGFVKNAKLNVAPVLYGSCHAWRRLRPVMPGIACSAVVSRRSNYSYRKGDAKTYGRQSFVNKLPGYTAQNATFEMMIAFLFVISLIIIAVFLYILTMQKQRNIAVMRAQGIPNKTVTIAALWQAILLVASGTVLGLVAMAVTFCSMPKTVPLQFTPQIALAGGAGMLVMGIAGSLIPMRAILKIDPATAIGG